MYITEDDESQWYRYEEDSVDCTVDKSPRLRIAVQSTGKGEGAVLIVGKLNLLEFFYNHD